MKTLAALLIAIAVAFLPGTVAVARASAKATPYRLEGKLLEVSKGWIQVEVTKVVEGSGFKVGEKLKITENAKTTILQAGKPVHATKLVAGTMVDVSGQMVPGSPPTFSAATVRILK